MTIISLINVVIVFVSRLSKEKIDGEASLEVKRKVLLSPHPLSVLLNIKNQVLYGTGIYISLKKEGKM